MPWVLRPRTDKGKLRCAEERRRSRQQWCFVWAAAASPNTPGRPISFRVALVFPCRTVRVRGGPGPDSGKLAVLSNWAICQSARRESSTKFLASGALELESAWRQRGFPTRRLRSPNWFSPLPTDTNLASFGFGAFCWPNFCCCARTAVLRMMQRTGSPGLEPPPRSPRSRNYCVCELEFC